MDAPLALTLIDAGLAHCHRVIEDHGGLMISLFMAGLVGGWSHCAGMCGPFVLTQVTARLERVPARAMSELHRLTGAAVLPYHLGRATTYAGLGVAVALVGQGLAALPGMRWVSAGLLGVAALFFLAYGLRGLAAWLALPALPVPAVWSDRLSRLARPLFGNPVGWRGYGLGVMLGFIPCGLLYGALAAAAASGDPLAGGLAMAAFAAGTVPSLFSIGLAGHLAGRTWGSMVRLAAPAIMVVNAVVLAAFAMRLAAA